jgi:hypothetical protein
VTVRRHHDKVCFEILGSSNYGRGRLALDDERLATSVSEVTIGNSPESVVDGFFPIRDWFQGSWQRRGDDVDNAHRRPVTRGETVGHLKSGHRRCLKLDRAENLSEKLSHTRQSISRANIYKFELEMPPTEAQGLRRWRAHAKEVFAA